MRGEQALDWAHEVLRHELSSNTFGSVTFLMENGVIHTAKVERLKKPPVDKKP